MSKTRIICTLGPASTKPGVLKAMAAAGMDVVRLNLSHGAREDHLNRIKTIREISEELDQPIEILMDLEGFRIRIGEFPHEPDQAKELKTDQVVCLTNDPSATGENIIPLDYPHSLEVIEVGCKVFIDDGNIALQATSSNQDCVTAQVLVGGVVKERKGVNIPGVHFEDMGLSLKDLSDIEFALENKVHLLAQSFVRSAQDVADIRSHLGGAAKNVKVVAKIENREGIANIDDIIDVTDGIMIARGDMGVSLPMHEVPIIQKIIIRKCRARNRCVITATQMLESMTTHLRPTRAEVSDVANAVLDGTDFVMLSGETAVGQHPVETVKRMRAIVGYAEQSIPLLLSQP